MLDDFQISARKVIEHFTNQLKQIRTGRAQPSLVDQVDVVVQSYGGTKMPLRELASITAPDATLLIVQPYDPGVLADAERALHEANLGISPVVDQNVIRLVIPPLTEERRKEFIKVVSQKAEEAKIAIRNLRNDVKALIEDQEGDDGISEDFIHQQVDELQKAVNDFNQEIEQLKEQKEKELLTI